MWPFQRMSAPVISIITATYNRSNILVFSIQSVLRQTFSNWELIVIGDHCTDDTVSVVEDFGDPRITFINLEKNFGEQSGPNNVGLKQAKGTYIAFLNHDDLWFPDHLETALETLKTSRADLVLAAGFIDHQHETHLSSLSGVVSEKHGYHPSRVFVPASNWLFRRELIDEIGLWRKASDLYLVPSHDWLRRVYDAGKSIVPTRQFTVIAVPSSSRNNAYKTRQSDENHYYADQLAKNPNFREQMLTKSLYSCFEHLYYDENTYYWRFFTKKLKTIFIKLGLNTIEFHFMRKFGKGGVLRSYRKKRGLEIS
ncbi:glycosyltransferase family 2 protein [Dyadobacter sp. CY323]|uniref:glycosyltransferase family 2 protein n=1 Tax=Dyadobacter sp. CY323 TaxID=2907302 RepID=UPI001F1AAAFC|nr:glycosyltransferase family 2 protein [Dyadobacter sp. CY323]MCE6989108.1 glycosyltransferase [Dyadobacter sp. CY323]